MAPTPDVWHDARVVRGFARQTERRRGDLAAGARQLGWKTGLASRAAMAALGTSGGLVGYLTDATQLASGSTVDVEGWTSPVLEPEVAVRMGAKLGAGSNREEADAAIDGMAAAIEVADVDAPLSDPERILATNIFHRAVILGTFVPSTVGARPPGPTLSVISSGHTVADKVDALAIVGDIADVVRHVADTLSHLGDGLSPGDVIITGSSIPALTIAANDSVLVDYSHLGAVSVRVTDRSQPARR